MLVLTALMLPAVLALGALALGVTTLWTAHDDVQRSVDLGSLAGAASTPTISVDPTAAHVPIPVEGLPVTFELPNRVDRRIEPVTAELETLERMLDPTDWQQRPCSVVEDQFLGDRSIVTNSFRTTGATCTATWQWESTIVGALVGCAADVLDVTGCAGELRTGLANTLPVLDSIDPAVAAINADAAALVDRYTNPADRLVTSTVARLLPDGCVEVTRLSALLPPVCTKTVSELLDELGLGGLGGLLGSDAGPATPQVGVDIDRLIPAAVTPRIQVQLDGTSVQPVLSPMAFDVSRSATARRTIKSALVLPSVGIPGLSSVADFDALTPDTKVGLIDRLGDRAAELLADAGPDGFVIDPNDLTRQSHEALDDTIDAIDQLDTVVSEKLRAALEDAACGRAPASRWCPEITSVVSTSELRGSFVQDVKDATQPPPSGAEPSLNQMLDYYATTGDPVMMVGALRRYRPAQFFGESAWAVLTDPEVNPALAPLLSPLMFIPALDVVPATIGRTVISDQVVYTVHSIPVSDTLATRGLYQGRLVK